MRIMIIFFLLISNNVLADIINIDNKKFRELLKQGIPVIDVRTKKEWNKTGVIKNSHLISMINDQGKYSLKDWYTKYSKIELKDNKFISSNKSYKVLPGLDVVANIIIGKRSIISNLLAPFNKSFNKSLNENIWYFN